MQPFETIYVEKSSVACDGDGGGVDGHPRVYLHLDAEGRIECPYCSRLFVHASKRGMVETATRTPGTTAGTAPKP